MFMYPFKSNIFYYLKKEIARTVINFGYFKLLEKAMMLIKNEQ